jgi:hypothetical protein
MKTDSPERLRYLQFGGVSPFASIDDERECWERHKNKIIADWKAQQRFGTRPVGWWRNHYHLSNITEPPPLARQIKLLLINADIDAFEAHQIERAHPMFSPDTKALDDLLHYIPAVGELLSAGDRQDIEESIRDFATIAAFHTYRSRPALAERYLSALATMSQVLENDIAEKEEQNVG